MERGNYRILICLKINSTIILESLNLFFVGLAHILGDFLILASWNIHFTQTVEQ